MLRGLGGSILVGVGIIRVSEIWRNGALDKEPHTPVAIPAYPYRVPIRESLKGKFFNSHPTYPPFYKRFRLQGLPLHEIRRPKPSGALNRNS